MAKASRPRLLLPPILPPKYPNPQPPSALHYRSEFESSQTSMPNEAYPINSNQCYYSAPQPPHKKRKIDMEHMHNDVYMNHNVAPGTLRPEIRNIAPHIHMHDDIIVDIVTNARKQKEKEEKMQSQQQPYSAPVCHYNDCNQCHVNNSYESQETSSYLAPAAPPPLAPDPVFTTTTTTQLFDRWHMNNSYESQETASYLAATAPPYLAEAVPAAPPPPAPFPVSTTTTTPQLFDQFLDALDQQTHVQNSNSTGSIPQDPWISNNYSPKRYYSPDALKLYAEMDRNINCFK